MSEEYYQSLNGDGGNDNMQRSPRATDIEAQSQSTCESNDGEDHIHARNVKERNDALASQMATVALIAAFMTGIIFPLFSSFSKEQLLEADAAWAAEGTEWRIMCFHDGHNKRACARNYPISWMLYRMAAITATFELVVIIASCSVILLTNHISALDKPKIVANELRFFLNTMYVCLGMGCAFLIPTMYFVGWPVIFLQSEKHFLFLQRKRCSAPHSCGLNSHCCAWLLDQGHISGLRNWWEDCWDARCLGNDSLWGDVVLPSHGPLKVGD